MTALDEKISVRFGSASYRIKTLKATADKYPTDYVHVSQLCGTFTHGYLDSLYPTDVDAADLTEALPVLLHRGKHYVLDGAFTVAKALHEHRLMLPCKILSIGDMALAAMPQSTDFVKLRYPTLENRRD